MSGATTNPMPPRGSAAAVERAADRQRQLRAATAWAAALLLAALAVGVWRFGPDWSGATGVRAPLTRNLLYIHPPAAWASMLAYTVVFAASIAYLNERKPAYDRAAHAAAGAGFALNTVALWTGTLWGMQEWSDSGRGGLATVYAEPKVLVVVVLWATFGAYLLVRRVVPGRDRAARLSAVFALLGFVAVPASFVTSRLLSTSLHPDIGGPGANPDAALDGNAGALLLLGFLALAAVFAALWVRRLQALALEDARRLEADA